MEQDDARCALMLSWLATLFERITNWANGNDGVLSIVLFLLGLFIAWISGIFTALRRRPEFSVRTIAGPTFCCTFSTGTKHNDFDVHRSGFALYLRVANVGSAASSIEDVSVAYHWFLKPISWTWLRYRVGWFWILHEAIALTDFQVGLGTLTKVYPFLKQRSVISGDKSETFLEPGRSTNGVVYFEQDDSWGGCFPFARHGKVKVKVRIVDSFGGKHVTKFVIPAVSLEEARRYNPRFGETYSELRSEAPFP